MRLNALSTSMKSMMNRIVFHYYSQKWHIEYTAFIHEKRCNYNVNRQYKTPYEVHYSKILYLL